MLAQVLLRNELSFQPHNICSSLFSFMNEILGMNVLPAFYMHLCMCTVYTCTCTLVLQRPEEGIGSLDIGITGGSELPCVCWKLNLGVLQEQPLVLISESSLQFPSPPHPQIL